MTEVDLETYENQCHWDYVTVYDGETADSPVLHTYCIPGDTSEITSTGTAVLVVFQTDESADYGRFSLYWSFVGSGQGGSVAFICISLIGLYSDNRSVRLQTRRHEFTLPFLRYNLTGRFLLSELCITIHREP